MLKKPLRITEVVLRDGHQSLLATRMKTEHMLPIAEKMDKAGFWSVEMWGGATFDSCIRFLNENPWDRIRALKKLMPKTPFQMLLRGQNLVGYRHYADDLVEKFVDLACDAGIDIFRIFDALNDLRNIKTSVARVRKNGRHAQGAISFTTSPVHKVQLFVEMAKRLEDMGVDTICVKDMAGLLAPWDAFELISGIKKAVKIPVHLHTHTTSGLAMLSVMKAIEAGVDGIDTAMSPLSMGTSHSPTETVVAALEGTEHDTGLDLDLLAEIGEYFAGIRKEYSAFESAFTGVDVNILKSQVPGGMISNLESQLKQQNAYNRLPEVMEELPRCRKDLGYPPLVTPTSQIVGTQAVMNVLMGRYKVITKETQALIEGKYGKVPGEMDAELVKRVCGDKEVITVRPADLLEPEWDRLKKEVADKATKDEDVIVFALFPQVAEQYMKKRGLPPAEKFKKEETAPAHPAPVQQIVMAAPSGVFRVTLNGKAFDVRVDDIGAPGGAVRVAAPSAPVAAAVTAATAAASAPKAAVKGTAVTSPLSGSIFKVLCETGKQVKEGELLFVMEAMKMETEVHAPCGGTVVQVAVTQGDKVETGDTLATIG